MWTEGLILHHVLDDRGNIQNFDNFGDTVCPLKMEYDTMVKPIGRKVDYSKMFCNDDFA